MPKANSTAGKSKASTLSSPEAKQEGVLRITCPACGKSFRYKRGLVKHPSVTDIDKYLVRAQCCYCGQLLRVKENR